MSDILLSGLSDAVDRRLPNDANRFYTKLKAQKVMGDDEMNVLLFQLDKVVASALPKADDAAQQAYDSFAFLLQQLMNDAPGAKEKVKAYYLLLAYAIATNKETIPGPNVDRSRQDVFIELRDFLKSHPEAKLQKNDISDDLRQRGGLLTGAPSGELQRLNQLAIKT